MVIDVYVSLDEYLDRGVLPIEEVREAGGIGFDGVVLAARGRLLSEEDRRTVEESSGVRVFRGQIVSCREGDVLVIGHDSVLPSGLSSIELKAAYLRDSGACSILVLSNASEETRSFAVRYMYKSFDSFDLFDALLIYGSGISRRLQRKYLDDRRRILFCAVGGSACATPGLYCTKFYQDVEDEKSLAAQVRAGRVYPCPINGFSVDPRGGDLDGIVWNVPKAEMIKTRGLIFDLYGTLIDLKSSETHTEFHRLAMWLSSFNVQVSGDVLMRYYRQRCSELYAKAQKDVKFPEVDILQVLRDAVTLFSGRECSVEFARKAALIFRAVSIKSIRLYPNTRRILRELRRRGYNMGVISNAQAAFTVPEIEDLRLWQFFDFVILSSDVGCSKPEGDIYKIASRQLEIPPERTAFIGDDLFGDIFGASAHGYKTVFVKTNVGNLHPPESITPDVELVDGDLRNLLRVFP